MVSFDMPSIMMLTRLRYIDVSVALTYISTGVSLEEIGAYTIQL